MPGRQRGQADEGSIAEWGDGFQRHVAGLLDGPFTVLFRPFGYLGPVQFQDHHVRQSVKSAA